MEETLKFTAELRLPPNLDKIERQDRIDDVLVQMGLVHARGTVVGHALKKGISGGERKRLCVAMELLTKPHLLFLDEPTSGLDSVTSLALCSKLRSLVDQRLCTVVTTIHQPQAKIFRLFTHLLLLKAGNIVYQGKTSGALEFFESVGQPVPMHENPAVRPDSLSPLLFPQCSCCRGRCGARARSVPAVVDATAPGLVWFPFCNLINIFFR